MDLSPRPSDMAPQPLKVLCVFSHLLLALPFPRGHRHPLRDAQAPRWALEVRPWEMCLAWVQSLWLPWLLFLLGNRCSGSILHWVPLSALHCPPFFFFFKLSHTGRAGFVSNLWVDSQAPSVLSLLFTSQTENHMTVTI